MTVRDAGIGIPADAAHHFRHVHAGRPVAGKIAGGLGIGLTLVRQWWKCMAATSSPQRGEGKGAEFVVRLPMASVVLRSPANDHGEQRAARARAAFSSRTTTGMRRRA